jgi:hypothetical protein
MASSLLNRLHEIREDHARRRALWRELSSYQSVGAINDIEAAIARSETQEDPETQQILRILAVQRTTVLNQRA